MGHSEHSRNPRKPPKIPFGTETKIALEDGGFLLAQGTHKPREKPSFRFSLFYKNRKNSKVSKLKSVLKLQAGEKPDILSLDSEQMLILMELKKKVRVGDVSYSQVEISQIHLEKIWKENKDENISYGEIPGLFQVAWIQSPKNWFLNFLSSKKKQVFILYALDDHNNSGKLYITGHRDMTWLDISNSWMANAYESKGWFLRPST